MDIFDRIAAALKALSSGVPATDPAVTDHLKAIDDHLGTLDGADTDEKTRMDTIEAGLNKIADAVSPPPVAAPATTGDVGTPAAGMPGNGAPAPAVDGAAQTDAAGNPVLPPVA